MLIHTLFIISNNMFSHICDDNTSLFYERYFLFSEERICFVTVVASVKQCIISLTHVCNITNCFNRE